MPTVIIADSNHLIREGLKSVLSGHDDITIVGEAEDSNQLAELIAEKQADVIIIDYTADGFTIDTIPKLINKNTNSKFLAITYDQSANTIIDALRSGVSSHVKKSCSKEEIVDSIRDTGKGQQFFCSKILETIQRESIDIKTIGENPLPENSINLTTREIEVIKLIAEGYTNNQVAEKLFVSNHTITTHRKNIMHKLGVNNTAGIVMYAVKYELISPNKFLFNPAE